MINWESEVRYQTRLRDQQGPTPYQEAAKWKRRFWMLVLAITIAIGVIAVALNSKI